MTPEEREIVINTLIDNNIGYISPKKLREVLKVLNNDIKITDAGAVNAISPLAFNNFTNRFSIQLVSASQNGYLSKEDYALFKNNATVEVLVTSKRFSGSGQFYTLPAGAKAFKAWINDGVQHLEQTGFESDLNTFKQAGNVVEFKKTVPSEARIVIDYRIENPAP
jgi:hypothetical protein